MRDINGGETNLLFNIFLETFHMNPRLCLSLQETGDVVMALNQHTAMDPKVIGFTGYPLSPSGMFYNIMFCDCQICCTKIKFPRCRNII